jgi:probable rRNA maturation factor
MAAVNFFNLDTTFKLSRPRKTTQWIREVISREKRKLAHLTYIFCSDNYLLSINQQYLKHKTLTDIITFDYSDGGPIEGDVFVSVDRVRANAEELKTEFDEELHRVLIHGVLHLTGYADKSPAEKSVMRKKEDAYLSLRKNL